MNDNIFEKNTIPKTYIALSLPVVTNMVISIIYNFADTYFISATGNMNIVAGVSLCSPVFMLLMAFGNILGQGASSLMSRLIGKNDVKSTERVSAFSLYAALVIGVAAGIFMFAFQEQFLQLLGATEETYLYAWQYYIVLSAGAPLTVLTFIHSNLLRCEGMAKESMTGSVSGTVLNMILDPIFISVFGWGAFGAAFATILGYALSVVILFVTVRKKSAYMSVNVRDAHVSRDEFSQILGIGIPAALTNIMNSICIILVNQFLIPYGSERIACMGICLKIMMVGTLILVGFSFGGAPLEGYFYGKGNRGKLRETVKFAYVFLAGLGCALLVLLYVTASPVLSLFIKDAELLDIASVMLRFQAAGLPFMGIVLVSSVLCQSAGKVRGSLILSLSRQGFVFIAAIVILSHIAGYTGIIASQAVADVISSAIAAFVVIRDVVPDMRQAN